VRQSFSADEDVKLKELVTKLGESNWKGVADRMINRTSRQCRERYKSYIAPNLSYSPWTNEEDELLRAKYLEIGPNGLKWRISSLEDRMSISKIDGPPLAG
jgi:hypothetical protein